MSLLSDYRKRIKILLAADDIQKELELEGVSTISARAIGISRAVVAQRSLGVPTVNKIANDSGKNKSAKD